MRKVEARVEVKAEVAAVAGVSVPEIIGSELRGFPNVMLLTAGMDLIHGETPGLEKFFIFNLDYKLHLHSVVMGKLYFGYFLINGGSSLHTVIILGVAIAALQVYATTASVQGILQENPLMLLSAITVACLGIIFQDLSYILNCLTSWFSFFFKRIIYLK